jgi:DNA-binding NtrC family response regulator
MSDEATAVLVVEDEPLVRMLVADVLVEAGFRVIEAVNAEEALTILSARADVSVLLSDVDLPGGVHGYALARQVHHRWPQVEVLLTSGRKWPTAGDLPPGAAFLAKPCPNDVLVSYVQAAAARAIATRQGAPAGPNATSDDPTVIPFPKTG